MSKELEANATPLYTEVKQLIDSSRQRVYAVVNAELTLLYWNIGKHIQQFILKDGRADYGKQILQTLFAKLVEEYGNGFSERSLGRMIKFFEFFPDQNILPTLLAKLSWSHFIQLLSVKDETKTAPGNCRS